MPMRHRAAAGAFAIYSVPTLTSTDDAPLTDPYNHLSRLKIHSAFKYRKVIDERTINVTFSARTSWNSTFSNYVTSVGEYTAEHFLFAHGRPGKPRCLASANAGGKNPAFTGSLPVQQGTLYPGGAPSPWARWVSIGCDGTNVYAFEYNVVSRIPASNYSGIYMPAITVPITVWVTEKVRP